MKKFLLLLTALLPFSVNAQQQDTVAVLTDTVAADADKTYIVPATAGATKASAICIRMSPSY